MNEPPRSYSTIEIARRLGVSPQTVQRWVDSGRLKAWKTPGGHRRIDAQSAQFLFEEQQQVISAKPEADPAVEAAARPLRVLVVDDNAMDRELMAVLVQHDHINFRKHVWRLIKRMRAIVEDRHTVAGTLQQTGHHERHDLVIVNIDNVPPGAAWSLRQKRQRFNQHDRIICRQPDAEGRPAPKLAFNGNGAAVTCDDAMHHRQAQTRAFAFRLGGEERFEYASASGLVHAGAVVADEQPDVSSSGQNSDSLRSIAIQRQFLSANFDAAGPSGQGLPRVGAQVDQRLLDLGGIGKDLQRSLGDQHLNRDSDGQRWPKQSKCFVHQVAYLTARRSCWTSPGEREDLLNHFSASHTRLANLLQALYGRVAKVQIIKR